MPDETAKIRHELYLDLGDRVEALGLHFAFLAFVGLLCAVLAAAAVVEVLGDRRRARRRQEAAQRAQAARSAGVADGFERGWHG